MTLNSQGTQMYVGDRLGVLHVIDPRGSGANKKSSFKINLSSNTINGLSLNPTDENMLASAGKDRMVRVWDVRNIRPDKPTGEWKHEYSVNGVHFSQTGRMVSGRVINIIIFIFIIPLGHGVPRIILSMRCGHGHWEYDQINRCVHI